MVASWVIASTGQLRPAHLRRSPADCGRCLDQNGHPHGILCYLTLRGKWRSLPLGLLQAARCHLGFVETEKVPDLMEHSDPQLLFEPGSVGCVALEVLAEEHNGGW